MAGMILLFSTFLLVDGLTGGDSGLYNLQSGEVSDAVLSSAPGMPSVGTMIGFFLIGFGGLFYSMGLVLLTRSFGLIAAGIGFFALVGFFLREPVLAFYSEGLSTAVAVSTSIVLLLIGGVLFELSNRDPLDLKDI